MDVLSIIKQEHRLVDGLFAEVEHCEPGDDEIVELARRIHQELTLHLTVEERLFYAKIRERAEAGEEQVDMFEAYTEHLAAKKLMELIQSERKHDERFKAELLVLGESVRHHVKEEESTVFSLAKEYLDQDEREAIGEQWERAKSRASRNGASRNGASRKKTSRASGARKKTRVRR